MDNFEEKQRFVRRSFREIQPLLNKDEQDLVPDNEKGVDSLLERYKNKLFYEDIPNSNSRAKRVLLTANDPGSYNIVKSLIMSLETEPRCKGIGALVSGYARKTLESEFKNHLTAVESTGPGLMQETLELSEKKPIDVVVGTVTGLNGPEGFALYGGKSSLGAKKIFHIVDGWAGLGSQFYSGNEQRMDEIDAILCADELAKKIFQHQLPGIPESKFEITGSPTIDGLVVENPADFARQARKKMGLGENTLALVFAGDISFESQRIYGCDGLVNEKTFAGTLSSVIELASENPGQQYALLIRPHPRDPNKADLFAQAEKAKLPENLQIISAGNDIASIQEVRYAADVVMSIASTENFLVPKLGKSSIFLDFKEEDLGGRVLDKIYGPELMGQIIATNPDKINLSVSPEQLLDILKNCRRATQDFSNLDIFKQPGSIERIKDRILRD